jgi:hypothetical protein
MNVTLQGRTPKSFMKFLAATAFVSFVTFVAFAILSSVSNPTYSSVEEKKFWAGLEGEFEVLPTDQEASGIAMFKHAQDSI